MKIKIKLKSLSQFIKYLNLIIGVSFTVTLVYFGYFLYQNVYLSTQKIEKINSLKSGSSFSGEIQTDLYQRVSENLSRKQQGQNIDFNNLKNPFQSY